MKQRKGDKPYIGITGFMSGDEVRAMLNLMPKNCSRKLMVGVLTDWRTLNGLTPNKWPNRYPAIKEIPGIFTDHPVVLNIAHYHTRELTTLHWQLENLVRSCGPNLHGLQLNIAWPHPMLLKLLRAKHPGVDIILQIGDAAFEIIKHSPERLAAKITEEYDGLIDRVLLDPSGGTGKEFDPAEIAEYLSALKKTRLDFGLNFGLGVAGGLSSKNLRHVELLLSKFPDLSIDAEGRLRNPDDHLDLREAGEYIRGALEMFSV